VTSEWYMDPQGLSGAYWEDDPYQGVSENTRRRESDETFYCGAPVEGYDNRWDLKADDPDFEARRREEFARRREEFERLLAEEEIQRSADDHPESPSAPPTALEYLTHHAEFELLLSNEHDELKSTISHYEQVFESISALCVLHRNGVMDARRVVTTIETIMREGASQ